MPHQTPSRPTESVWDYPRPPKLEAITSHVVITFGGEVLADSRSTFRVLETSHPPVYYLPPRDIRMDRVEIVPGSSFCEFKGQASYVSLVANGSRSERAGWFYMDPAEMFRPIANHIAFYVSRVDQASVDGEAVRAQPGDFYGGWITSWIAGPFKGGPGTVGW